MRMPQPSPDFSPNYGMLELIILVLAGMVIVGAVWDWFRNR